MGGSTRPTAAAIGTAALVFAASLFVFDRAFSAGLGGLSRWAEQRWDLRADLGALPDKGAYEVLVLGTSRAFESVHPAAIERALGVKAYKEAGRGKGLRYAFEFYRLYREAVGPPRVLLYVVDYFMFGNPSDPGLLDALAAEPPGRAARRRAGFVPLWTVADKQANERRLARIIEGAQRRIASAVGEFAPERNQADMAAYTGRAGSRVVPAAEPARYERVGYARFPGEEGEFLRRLIDACAADGVQVMFVYPPDYLPTRKTNYEHEAFVADVRRLIADAPHAAFFDYDEGSGFPVSDASLFWDGGYGNPNSHLSRRGAERFAALYLPDLAAILRTARPRPR